jgi:hypothetical protein
MIAVALAIDNRANSIEQPLFISHFYHLFHPDGGSKNTKTYYRFQ